MYVKQCTTMDKIDTGTKMLAVLKNRSRSASARGWAGGKVRQLVGRSAVGPLP